MDIKLKPGRKEEHGPDKIVVVNGSAISFRDVLTILKHMFENEDRIYPQSHGYLGRTMLYQAIGELHAGVSIEDIARRYKLKDVKKKD